MKGKHGKIQNKVLKQPKFNAIYLIFDNMGRIIGQEQVFIPPKNAIVEEKHG